MADIIIYLDSQPKPTDIKDSDGNDKCNVFPCMLTYKTCNAVKNGCNAKLSAPDYNVCCWVCLPFSVTFDIITFIPFLTIYKCKKCLSK